MVGSNWLTLNKGFLFMPYYANPDNAKHYIAMADGYDGRELIAHLREYLPRGAFVLELGMGPGKDIDLLCEHFVVTGSDQADFFVERYQKMHPKADLLLLDAATLETDRMFDGIYSNKVLYHLTRDALIASFKRQVSLLHEGGIALHSFWVGDGDENMHGLHFAYYTEETLLPLIDERLCVVEIGRYAEMAPNDSLFIILQKVKQGS